MVENSGGPNWKGLTLPPGRTQKACTHAWAKMKAEAAKAEWYAEGKNAGQDGGNNDGANDAEKGKMRVAKGAGEGAKKRTKKEDGSGHQIKSEDEGMA